MAPYLRAIDVPDGQLKKHSHAVPYLGGVAVFIGFIVPCLYFIPTSYSHLFFIFVLAWLLIIGLIDDLLVVSPLQKFIGQLIGALFILGNSSTVAIFANPMLNAVLLLFWILSVINATNLVDVMDGLTATLTIVASGSFVVMSLIAGKPYIAIWMCALLGGVVAFFYYNKPPARIYLGDAGTLFIGGLFAATSLQFNWTTYGLFGYIVPLGLLGIFLLEGISLIIIRWHKKIPVYLGSPDHYSLLLLKRNWSKQGVLAISFLFASFASSIALLFAQGVISPLVVGLSIILFMVAWLKILLY